VGCELGNQPAAFMNGAKFLDQLTGIGSLSLTSMFKKSVSSVRTRDSSVGIATGYGLEGRGAGVESR
jgi:hypothetical protein